MGSDTKTILESLNKGTNLVGDSVSFSFFSFSFSFRSFLAQKDLEDSVCNTLVGC